MARKTATEPSTPIRKRRTDHFLNRYRARESATTSTGVAGLRQLKDRMARAQGLGGLAFGPSEACLAHDQLKTAANDVQDLFENGHTVMKTVISFTSDYLKRHGLIPDSFELRRRGDYRGQVDQMKLRMALMHGLGRMGRAKYDELRYVGVIQVDTEHVHCHLAMVDAGFGSRADDGTQKGKISQRAEFLLRRGIDTFLHHKQHVPYLPSAVGYERRNVSTFVKRWAHERILSEALPQFLIACLPEDRSLWRPSSNLPEMRKPNRIAGQMVEEVLSRAGSPMAEAMEQVRAWADHQVRIQGLDTGQRRVLVERGREQVVERGVNAVYALLRQLPGDALRVRTPMLDAMGLDYQALAARAHKGEGSDQNMLRFGLRLRSYSARLDHHTAQRQHAHRRVREWEAAQAAGGASAASRALYRFWQEEEEYQARVAAKYRSFLPFAVPQAKTWHGPWKRLDTYHQQVVSLEAMRQDQVLRKTKNPDAAERLARQAYGQAGGHLVALDDAVSLARLDDRIETMRIEYGRKLTDLRVELAGQGLVLEVVSDEHGQVLPRVSAGAEYPFEQVKGLDLHHLRSDFFGGVQVGNRAKDAFVHWAKRREEALEEAITYLQGSGQAGMVVELPESDVRAMGALVREVESVSSPVLVSGVEKLMRTSAPVRRSPTVALTQGLAEEVSRSVDEAITRPVELGRGAETAVRKEREYEPDR